LLRRLMCFHGGAGANNFVGTDIITIRPSGHSRFQKHLFKIGGILERDCDGPGFLKNVGHIVVNDGAVRKLTSENEI
jgi:hypothetical protein